MADIDDKINKAFMDIEGLKHQSVHLAAIVESERGSLDRASKRFTEELDKVKKEFHEIIYHSEHGLMIAVDRLKQESIERHSMRKHIYALWVMVGGGIITEILRIAFKPK